MRQIKKYKSQDEVFGGWAVLSVGKVGHIVDLLLLKKNSKARIGIHSVDI